MTVELVTLGKEVYHEITIGEAPELVSAGEVKPEIERVEDEPDPLDLRPEIIRAEEQ